MKNLILIARKEYFTRIKRKFFIFFTLLMPALMILIFALPSYFQVKKQKEKLRIAISDTSGIILPLIANSPQFEIFDEEKNPDTLKKYVESGIIDAYLIVPTNIESKNIIIFTFKPMDKNHSAILKQLAEKGFNIEILKKKGVDEDIMKNLERPVVVKINLLRDTNLQKIGVSTALGVIVAVLIYFFVFMYSAQIMNGVKEEKRNRIVEILVSSVKPIDLLTGKIIGITLVAFTQFLIWAIIGYAGFLLLPHIYADNPEITKMIKMISDIIGDLNLGFLIPVYLLYFFLGYLIYGLIFAAVASAVDNDSDMHQFTMPVTLPLILSMVFINIWVENPDSQLSFWFSMIPFTSPITMSIRIGSGVPDIVPYWQVFLSLTVLFVTFVLSAYIAAKIYKTGILMYGKKITYKELWKWLKY